MREIRAVYVHHTATPREWTVEQIRALHVDERGWADVAYHWLIRQPVDGVAVELHPGRPESETGAHVRGHNSDSIGVALIGDFEGAPLSGAIYTALVWHLAGLCARFGLAADAIHGHREADGAATVCPGRFVDVERLRADVGALLAA